MIDWTIEEVAAKGNAESTWDVVADRRVMHYDFADVEIATEFVRRHRDFDPKEDTVTKVDLRGDREKVDIRGR